MKAEIKLITPNLARRYLDMNVSNRPMRNAHIESLAGAIKRGEWKLSPQPISISTKGILLDGQHRLSAVVLSNKSVEMMVVTGVNDNTYDVIDTGVNRSYADVTGLNNRESGIINRIARIVYWKKATHQMCHKIRDIYGDLIHKFDVNTCKTTVTLTSSGIFKAGIIYQAYRHNNIDECIEMYNNLINMKFEQLSPIAQSYLRFHSRHVSNQVVKKITIKDSFNIGSIVFDAENKNKLRIKFKDCKDNVKFMELTRNIIDGMVR